MSQQVLLSYVMLMLNSIKPINVAHLQNLTNQCWIAHMW